MKKYTQRELKQLVKKGLAIDITNLHEYDTIKEPYQQIGYSIGSYGLNGKLLEGECSGKYYAITKRAAALFIF